MTRFLNTLVLVGFTVTCVAFVLDDFTLAVGGVTVWGIASLIDYCRN